MARSPLPSRLLGKIPVAALAEGLSGSRGTIASSAAIQLAALLGSLLIARRLGGAVRGEYAGATAWCGLIAALADFGVSQAMAYRSVRTKLAPGPTIGTGLLYAAISGTIAALLGLVAIIPLLGPRNPSLALATIVYLPSIPMFLVGSYCALVCQGLGRTRSFNAIRIALGLPPVLGVTASLLAGAKTGATVMVMILGFQTLALAASLWLLHRRATATAWCFDREELRRLLRFGGQTYLGSMARLANGRLDQMVMSVVLTSRDLGHYAVAASYAGLVFALANATTDANFAHLTAEISAEERRRRLRNSGIRLVRFGSGLAIALAALAPFILPAVFGVEFRASVVPAVILLSGATVLALNDSLGLGLRAGGRPILGSIGEAVGLIVTAVGLPFALSQGGTIGAALLSVISYVATCSTLFVLLRHLLNRSRADEMSVFERDG